MVLNSQTYSSKVKSTTSYLSGYVYESKNYENTLLASLNKSEGLQFVSHEEGRIRYKQPSNEFVYDYLIKDHLGNTRVVLTDEQQIDAYPAASLEASTLNNEKIYYSIPDDAATRVKKDSVAGYPPDSYTNPNDFIQKLNGNGTKVGTSITLKVMAGDSYNLRANSWYRLNGASPGSPIPPLASIVSSLISGVSAASAGKATITSLGGGIIDPAVTNFLNTQTVNSGRPKAYLNWVLLDEQFKYAGGGFEQVGDNEVFTTHTRTNLAVNKNGYLYVYVSNETPNVDVFFDNVQVTHIRGPLLEETHYYPFGLTMAGVSSKATGRLENKKKFNAGSELQSKEFSDGSGLELYSTPLRSLDPQLGRWLQIDSKPDYSQSLYTSMGNNPMLFNDPLGDTIVFPNASPRFKESFRAAAFELFLKGGGAAVSEIMSAKETVNVNEVKGTTTSSYNPRTKTINWNSQGGLITTKGVKLSPATILEHEADHANSHRKDPKAHNIRRNTSDKNYDNAEEKRVIQGSEQSAALAMGEIAPGKKTRTDHAGIALIITQGPLTTIGKIIPINPSQSLPEVVISSKKKDK